jgi:hypothetical protein
VASFSTPTGLPVPFQRCDYPQLPAGIVLNVGNRRIKRKLGFKRQSGSVRTRVKTLTGDRLALIDALVAESEVGGVMAALLQKTNTLTDPLRALLYCGTTLAACSTVASSEARSEVFERRCRPHRDVHSAPRPCAGGKLFSTDTCNATFAGCYASATTRRALP